RCPSGRNETGRSHRGIERNPGLDLWRSSIRLRQSEPPGGTDRPCSRSKWRAGQSRGRAAAALVVDRCPLPAVERRTAALFRRSSIDGSRKAEVRPEGGWIWQRSEVRRGSREDDE